jgi:hypothetical protein
MTDMTTPPRHRKLCRSVNGATNCCTIERMRGASFAIETGVKACATGRRRRVCSGGSAESIVNDKAT